MENKIGLTYIADVIAVIFTAVQPDEVLRYVSLGLTILATAFSIFFTIIQFINWFRKAKQDGVITEEEIKDGKKIVNDGIEDAKKHLKNK